MPRDPSPADTRCDLDPELVDAVAGAVHNLHRPLDGSTPAYPDTHEESDRSKARFILLGLRQAGWRIVRTTEEPS